MVSFSTKTHAHTYKYNTHLHTITCLASTTFSLDLKLVYQISFAKYVSYSISSGLGGPEEDHQLHHCCWTGRVSEREEEVFLNLSYVYIRQNMITAVTAQTYQHPDYHRLWYCTRILIRKNGINYMDQFITK